MYTYVHPFPEGISYVPSLGVLEVDDPLLGMSTPISTEVGWRGAVGVADILEDELLYIIMTN